MRLPLFPIPFNQFMPAQVHITLGIGTQLFEEMYICAASIDANTSPNFAEALRLLKDKDKLKDWNNAQTKLVELEKEMVAYTIDLAYFETTGREDDDEEIDVCSSPACCLGKLKVSLPIEISIS